MIMPMPMKLYNSLTKEVSDFCPISPPNVSLYVCGVTVYDYCHLGHARAYVTFDLLKRVLSHHGYNVTHIQNFTDIDDKIIARAIERKESVTQLTQEFIDAYTEDMEKLNIIPANNYPLATDHIPHMVKLIQSLIEKNAAYVVDGSVFFRINADKNYGQLSNKSIGDLNAGHRIDVNHQKESPLDFILWKPSKDDEPYWPSPWGNGRPGWHTECVAMVESLLGPHIDIHGGGADLKFPHHENELAQAKCAYHTPFVNVWVHNGFVTVDNLKMSKSDGNFFTLRDIYNTTPADIVRFFLMRTHYRSPLQYSTAALDDAGTAYKKLASVFDIVPNAPIPDHLQVPFNEIKTLFWQALYNDLNVSDAISKLFELHRLIHEHQCGTNMLLELGQSIGLFYKQSSTIPAHIESMAKDRWEAKKAKDFQTADQLRIEIESAGFIVEDKPDGYRVRTG